MAVQCSVKIAGDYALVNATDSSKRSLRFDISKMGCRMYENTRQQSKEYLDEIIRWCGERPMNAEMLSKSFQMFLVVRRREMGLPA